MRPNFSGAFFMKFDSQPEKLTVTFGVGISLSMMITYILPKFFLLVVIMYCFKVLQVSVYVVFLT